MHLETETATKKSGKMKTKLKRYNSKRKRNGNRKIQNEMKLFQKRFALRAEQRTPSSHDASSIKLRHCRSVQCLGRSLFTQTGSADLGCFCASKVFVSEVRVRLLAV